MTITTTTIAGFVVLPTDATRARSSVIFTMTGFDTEADSDAVIIPVPVEAAIAADGSIDIDLWPNPEGVRATLYSVQVSAYVEGVARLISLGSIEVPASVTPLNLNDLLAVAPPADTTLADYIAYLAAAIASTESSADAASDSAVAAAASAADAALFFGPMLSGTGDGVADDQAAIEAWMAEVASDDVGAAYAPKGTFKTTSIASTVADTVYHGVGQASTVFKRDTDGQNLWDLGDADGVTIENVTLDLDWAAIHGADPLDGNGHGIAARGQDIKIDNVTVKDFGPTATNGASGILFYSVADSDQRSGLSVTNCDIIGSMEPSAGSSDDSFGIIVEDGFASSLVSNYVYGVNYMAFEFKNNTEYSAMVDFIAEECGWLVGLGNDRADTVGANYNVHVGGYGKSCDNGILISKGDYNLFDAIGVNVAGSPDLDGSGLHNGVYMENGAKSNAVFSTLLTGAFSGQRVVRFTDAGTDKNYVEAAVYDYDGQTVFFNTGVKANVVHIAHTGEMSSLAFSKITDSSGIALTSTDANVVISPSTGEQFGSRSGMFAKYLSSIRPSFFSSTRWRFVTDTNSTLGLGVTGTAGDNAGWSVGIVGTSDYAHQIFVKGSSAALDYIKMKVGTDVARLYNDKFVPAVDAATALGSTTLRFGLSYLSRLKVGTTGSINANAALEVASTTGVMMLPRMTTTQRDAIAVTTGVAFSGGEVIFNTTTSKVQAYASGAWVDLHA